MLKDSPDQGSFYDAEYLCQQLIQSTPYSNAIRGQLLTYFESGGAFDGQYDFYGFDGFVGLLGAHAEAFAAFPFLGTYNLFESLLNDPSTAQGCNQ